MCIFFNKWKDFEPTTKYLSIVSGLTTITKLHNYLKQFKWQGEKAWKDYWKTPIEFIENKDNDNDCLEENTEILVNDGIKRIKDLKSGDLVLSYNYDREQYEYKKVINVWDKGILDGYKIKLKNGHSIIATNNHRFYCRTRENYPEKYEVKRLEDINFSYWCKKQIHCIHLLPEGDIDFNKDLAYLYGIYLAEGYGGEHHICIAQDKKDIRKKIEQTLNNLNIPYSKSKRTTHAFYTILKSGIKDDLSKLGLNSFDKKLPLEVLNWNRQSLKKLIEGILDGDGTDRNKKWNPDNSLWEFSTSSEQVAKMFNIICRKVYGNCWFYKQEIHQGVGNKPIYRLRYNPKGLSNKERLNGISTVTIKSLEKILGKHYYDIEVEDNHNFVLTDSGVISHNCEDFARFAVDVLVRIMGITGARFIAHSGYDKSRWGNKIWNIKYHAICVFPYQDKLAVFSNNGLFTGLSSYEGAGHITFPDGLKYQQVRDWQGKVLSKKFKLFGTF